MESQKTKMIRTIPPPSQRGNKPVVLWIKPQDKVLQYPFDQNVISAIKSLGAFWEPEWKVWILEKYPICSDAVNRLGLTECVDGNFFKSFIYTAAVDDHEVQEKTCYKVEKWRTENGRRKKEEEIICLSKKRRKGIGKSQGD
nr:MAG: hypothetical protein TU36_01620 [Vulcanisaeta sp. AZ3]